MATLWHGSAPLVAGINHVVTDSRRQDQYKLIYDTGGVCVICVFTGTCYGNIEMFSVMMQHVAGSVLEKDDKIVQSG